MRKVGYYFAGSIHANKLTCNFWPRVGQQRLANVGSTSRGGALSPEFPGVAALVVTGTVAAEDEEGPPGKTVLPG